VASSNVRLAGGDWDSKYISHLNIPKVPLPPVELISVHFRAKLICQDTDLALTPGIDHDAKVAVVAFATTNIRADAAHVKSVTQYTLQSHGQLFAFQKQPDLDDGALRVIAEFCDPAAAVAAAIYPGVIIDVSLHCWAKNSKLPIGTDAKCLTGSPHCDLDL
jgi:hypothetical protein